MPRPVRVLAFDIDGTLTDGTTWYAGEELGWVQRYSVRDGEAILRLVRRGLTVVPLSRNKTAAARRRIELLRLPTRWLGVDDKLAALGQICAEYDADPDEVCFVGDGLDDARVMAQVGVSFAVHDAHPEAKRHADVVADSTGGTRVIEEIELSLEKAGLIPPAN